MLLSNSVWHPSISIFLSDVLVSGEWVKYLGGTCPQRHPELLTQFSRSLLLVLVLPQGTQPLMLQHIYALSRTHTHTHPPTHTHKHTHTPECVWINGGKVVGDRYHPLICCPPYVCVCVCVCVLCFVLGWWGVGAGLAYGREERQRHRGA